MDGKGIISMVLTQGSVAVCLPTDKRHGFDSMLRYAVFALLEKIGGHNLY